MKKRNIITLGNFIMALLILLFCAVCIIPIIPQSYIRIIQMVTTSILFIYMLLSFNQSNDIQKIGLGIIGYYVLILGYWGIGYSDASIGNYFFQITFFITIIAAYYFLRNLSSKYNILIYYVLLLFISIHYLGDIVVGQRFQDYSMRELREVGSNVIATSFSTLSLVVFCFSLVVLLNTRHKTTKYIHLTIVALNLYYIVFCGQRGSVVVLMLLALSLILYERFFHKNSTKRSTYIVFIVVASLLFFLFGDILVSLLIQLSPSDRLTARFEDMQGTMINGVNTESFSGRLSLSLLSIRTWLSNIITFLFGIGDHRLEGEWGMMGFYKSGIGGHSELIDSLARYGIIGFSIIAFLYYHICNYILKQFKIVQIKNQIRAIIITSVLIALTKGLFFPEIGIGLFLLLPLSSELLNKEKIKV